jgi:hypothetical protein
VPDLDAVELLAFARYDSQLRGQLPDRLPEGIHVESDGPLLRFVGFGHGGFFHYRLVGWPTASRHQQADVGRRHALTQEHGDRPAV